MTEKKEFIISLIITCVDYNILWRQKVFFKEIYKDTHPIFNKSDYKKWYGKELENWKKMTVDEKAVYVDTNITGIEEYENKQVTDLMYIAKTYSVNKNIAMTKELFKQYKKNG